MLKKRSLLPLTVFIVLLLTGCPSFLASQRKAALALKVSYEEARREMVMANLDGRITDEQLRAWWHAWNPKVIALDKAFIAEIAAYEAASALGKEGHSQAEKSRAKAEAATHADRIVELVNRLNEVVVAAIRAEQALTEGHHDSR